MMTSIPIPKRMPMTLTPDPMFEIQTAEDVSAYHRLYGFSLISAREVLRDLQRMDTHTRTTTSEREGAKAKLTQIIHDFEERKPPNV
jgi:hypothetical protein